MTWGKGYGTPFTEEPPSVGGGPSLVPVEQPQSEIGGAPTTFVFTDEPDGPLPGLWATYALDYDGVGAVVWEPEPDPNTLFRIADGFGIWQYTRAPTLPGPTDPFSERGFAAGPRNVLEGRNSRVRLLMRQPVSLLDAGADEFRFSAGIALHLDPVLPRFVGARMRATWLAGVWTEPLVLEIIVSDGGVETVLATEIPTALEPDLLDIWRNQETSELEVDLRSTTLTATLNGVVSVTAQVPEHPTPEVALLVQVFNRSGAAISPLPSVSAVLFQSLRDLDALGPPPQILGASHLEAPLFPMMNLPINELIQQGLLRQLRGRQFQFLQETEVEVQHLSFRFDEGEVVRAREKVGTQKLVPVTRDLHYVRTTRD